MNKLSSLGSYFVELPIEILISITDKLNVKDQQNLSWTCKMMYRLIRICHFGVASPVWEEVKIEGADNIPASCYRDDVWINARMMHTLNSIDHNHLALFGGRCHMKDGGKNAWTTCEDSTEMLYPRSIHSSTLISGRLYIYAGKELNNFEFPQNWVATNGKPPGSRITILGGIELYNFYYEYEKERPWEFVPSKHNWEHVKSKKYASHEMCCHYW
ncbi:4814_t:CDS:2 [Diversispora eburnea]|uniref:4814_t:CDS:1 n=1 Tax=Diversispora eburnea TaxID=1213867 RepID=A0A9N9ASA2_9GLOM|nr:4814_t:CDS:2 [Diversispora eburnea]